jgi:beta-phosphoglucomutase-like phosphatase (HAD superfamily)
LPLRAGVAPLLDDCARAAVMLAIVTTTGAGNVAALLGRQLGPAWRARFATVVCAEEAPRKKPDPQAYQVALSNLALQADAVVAIEDSPAGVEAARRAGIRVVLTRSHYFPDTPAGAGVLAAGPSLGDPRNWHPALASGAARVSLAEIDRWRRSAAA